MLCILYRKSLQKYTGWCENDFTTAGYTCKVYNLCIEGERQYDAGKFHRTARFPFHDVSLTATLLAVFR
jgi:hypothetical protein